MSSISAALGRLPLFQGLSPSELRVLKNFLRSRRLEPREALFAEGDPGRSCFVVISGKIGVYKRLPDGSEDRLAVLAPGALVGHMALIDQKPRSAGCRAEEAAVLIELQRAEFDRLFSADSPFAFKILDRVAEDLVERLRAVTEKLTEAHAARDDEGRRVSARAAAEAAAGFDTGALDLDDLDLDAITVEIPSLAHRMHARKG